MTPLKFAKASLFVLLILVILDRSGQYFFGNFIQSRRNQFFQHYPLNDIGIREELNRHELINLNTDKIIVLGNSVVFGYRQPVQEQTVSGFLQKTAAANANTQSFKFINAGMNGGSIWNEFPLLTEKLLAVNPRLVVWVAGNNDFLGREQAKKKANEVKRALEYTMKKSAEDQLLRNPGFYKDLSRYLFLRMNVFLSDWNSDSDFDQYCTNTLLKEAPPEVISEVTFQIKTLSERLSDQKIKFLAVFIPSRNFNKKYSWSDAKSFVKLQAELEKLNIPNLQLFDKFKAECPLDCFLDYEHLNEKGSQFLAEQIYAEIIRNSH